MVALPANVDILFKHSSPCAAKPPC